MDKKELDNFTRIVFEIRSNLEDLQIRDTRNPSVNLRLITCIEHGFHNAVYVYEHYNLFLDKRGSPNIKKLLNKGHNSFCRGVLFADRAKLGEAAEYVHRVLAHCATAIKYLTSKSK